MKKLMIILAMASLVSCSTVSDNVEVKENVIIKKIPATMRIFNDVNNNSFNIISTDNFETAVLNFGESKIALKREVSGSGVLLANKENNISLHFKEGDSIAILNIDGNDNKVFQNKLYYFDYKIKGTKEKVAIAKVNEDVLVLSVDNLKTLLQKNDKNEFLSEDKEIKVYQKNKVFFIEKMTKDGTLKFELER